MRFQRLLKNQLRARFAYLDHVTTQWSGLDVLDLGCGCGFMAEAVGELGARVVGVDPCLASLESARGHALGRGLAIDYRQGFGESLPMADDSVDRVVCVDVLEHVCDTGRVLAEVRRVLRPGGLFFFDTINRNRFARLLMITLSEGLSIIPKGSHDPQKFIRPEELRGLLQRAGFGSISRFVGMGVAGLDRRLDFEFALQTSTRVMYMGHAS
jgi:2-polyprenyl-6-hydroxyphenyl methylase/3-demethylubiquinone-9 3-methyltransferase